MKKWILSLFLGMVAVGLVACGSESADEIYTNAIEAAGEMNSAEVTIDMTQDIESSMEDLAITMQTTMEGSMIIDPMAMHQKGTVSMTMPGEGLMGDTPMEMETEQYLVDGEMYVYESFTGSWMKMDESMMPLEMLTSQQPDASEQLEMMEKYVEDFELEEKDNEYVFQLSADGDSFKELTEEMMNEYMAADLLGEIGGDMSEIFDAMEINHLDIEMVILKDSYEMKAYNLDMGMTMNIEGEEMTINQVVDTEYSNINSIDSIEVPQEIKDNAVDGMGM